MAIRVILTESSSVLSTDIPKKMVASFLTALPMSSPAALTAPSVSWSPPLTENSTPRAPLIEMLSSGLAMACLAASTAPVRPWPVPMAMSAPPGWSMMLRTSAKSTLISPGTLMSSETLRIP